jgi:hypothetical protein
MVRADFLERVRRYSFLLTLGFSVYLGYAVYAGQITLQLDTYRGVSNSAWLGSVIGLVGSVWLTLVGFYIVKNAIQRDRETRVGQILATTPMSKIFYTLSKMLSNFAVLAAMVLVLALAALVIQFTPGTDPHIEPFALFAPVLILVLSAVAVTAALAVLFESLPVLRGGVGNVFYFFLWTALIATSAASLGMNASSLDARTFTDYTGIASVVSQMQAQVRGIDPTYNNTASLSAGGQNATTRTFPWAGLNWTPALILSRAMLFALAVLIAMLAALFFDRFDPSRRGGPKVKNRKFMREPEPHGSLAASVAGKLPALSLPGPPQPPQSIAHLTPVLHAGSSAASKSRVFPLVLAELRLMLRGHAWWWYAVDAALLIACLASPLADARSTVLAFAWIWPVLLWSQMGTREAQFSTGALVFSAPRAIPRQFLASYAAGVLVTALTGFGLALHLLIAGDLAGLAAWTSGVLFIPALALALGVLSGSRKLFEALYTAWWYVGPVHHIRGLDFMGTTPESSTPAAYLAAAALLLLTAYLWRKIKLAHA